MSDVVAAMRLRNECTLIISVPGPGGIVGRIGDLGFFGAALATPIAGATLASASSVPFVERI